MLRCGIGTAVTARRDEFTKGGTIPPGEFGIGHEGKMQEAQRRRNGRKRPSMHLAQNGAAQRMRFEGHRSSSGETESGTA
jgi:hypothetical protein